MENDFRQSIWSAKTLPSSKLFALEREGYILYVRTKEQQQQQDSRQFYGCEEEKMEKKSEDEIIEIHHIIKSIETLYHADE